MVSTFSRGIFNCAKFSYLLEILECFLFKLDATAIYRFVTKIVPFTSITSCHSEYSIIVRNLGAVEIGENKILKSIYQQIFQ